MSQQRFGRAVENPVQEISNDLAEGAILRFDGLILKGAPWPAFSDALFASIVFIVVATVYV